MVRLKPKQEILSLLKDKLDGKVDMSYQDISRITGYSKRQLIRLSKEIEEKDIETVLIHGNSGKIAQNTEKSVKEKQNIEVKTEELSKEIESLSQEIKAYAEKNKDNQKYIDDLNFDITNLKISVTSFDESSNSIEEFLLRIEKDIENNKNNRNIISR